MTTWATSLSTLRNMCFPNDLESPDQSSRPAMTEACEPLGAPRYLGAYPNRPVRHRRFEKPKPLQIGREDRTEVSRRCRGIGIDSCQSSADSAPRKTLSFRRVVATGRIGRLFCDAQSLYVGGKRHFVRALYHSEEDVRYLVRLASTLGRFNAEVLAAESR